MTIINGANHNVEDILANIRSSIADETGPARLVVGEHFSGLREQPAADDTAEFELPAIFKPGHNSAPERPRLFNRLSDAIKNAESDKPRTVIPFDPSIAGRMLEPPAQAPAVQNTVMQGRQDPPRAQPAQAPEPEVKRIMPTFFDTRINRLGELTRKAYEKPEPEPAPQPAAEAPPALPEMSNRHHAAEHGAGGADDAAAQLLRPMLRQWLQENMPKIVEKALLSEMQGGPVDAPPKTRK